MVLGLDPDDAAGEVRALADPTRAASGDTEAIVTASPFGPAIRAADSAEALATSDDGIDEVFVEPVEDVTPAEDGFFADDPFPQGGPGLDLADLSLPQGQVGTVGRAWNNAAGTAQEGADIAENVARSTYSEVRTWGPGWLDEVAVGAVTTLVGILLVGLFIRVSGTDPRPA